MARAASLVLQHRLERKQESALMRAWHGWPALLLAIIVFAAAFYSFSPRPIHPFPETRVRADQLLVTGLAQSGERRIAVGELGRILVADSARGPWVEARVQPQRASTFTQVLFIDESTALAVGHDGWIVRSTDRGNSWKEMVFDPERGEPLLGVAGPYDGKLYAFGAFGQFLVSSDHGQTWTHELHESIGDRHLNAMTQAADGSLLIVGESGTMAQSRDGGASWTHLPQVYPGSFYGVISLPSKALLAFGMRGNAYVSRDFGGSWHKSEIPGGLSLYSGMVDGDGSAVLVGENSTVFRSTDDGSSFSVAAQGERERLAAVLPLQTGGWMTAGEGGVVLLERMSADAQSAPGTGAQP